MGALDVIKRGGVLAKLSKGLDLMSFTNEEMEKNYYLTSINMNGQTTGSLMTGVEVIGGSLRNIEKILQSGSSNINIKSELQDLRKMIEEYGNLEKLIK